MHIKEILYQARRDFTAIYKCEHCGKELKRGGYDDTNFHQNVIPDMQCGGCGKKADKDTYKPMGTKHPDWAVV